MTLVFLCGAILCAGCVQQSSEHDWLEVNQALELDARLAGADFSLVESDPEVVRLSWDTLEGGSALPRSWALEFAGTELELPALDASQAVGLAHTNGRATVVYPFSDIRLPSYGEILPLVVAHYLIPEPELDLVLLLVCFQSDPDGALTGVGVRSLDREGRDTSAPFALALRQEDVAGKYFYDEFLAGSEKQAIAARAGWDQGFLLLSRLTPDAVLSTYLPWY